MGTFRFFLATVIVYIHTSAELRGSSLFQSSFTYSAYHTIISFFIISGFIILLSLDKNYYKSNQSYFLQSSKFYLNIIRPSDYISRFPQIVDLEYIFQNVFLLFQWSWFDLNLINSVAWSIDVELHWYLAAPLVYYIFYHKYNSSIARISFYLFYIYSSRYFNVPPLPELVRELVPFFYGFIVYDIYLIYQKKLKNIIDIRYLLILSAILISSPLVVDFSISMYLYYLGVVFLCLSINFKHKIDKFFGDLSYPMFIIHQPLFFIIFLQVNKYASIFEFNEENSFLLIFLISMIFFIIVCYFILLIFQYPIDKLRVKIKFL